MGSQRFFRNYGCDSHEGIVPVLHQMYCDYEDLFWGAVL